MNQLAGFFLSLRFLKLAITTCHRYFSACTLNIGTILSSEATLQIEIFVLTSGQQKQGGLKEIFSVAIQDRRIVFL